MFIRVHSWLLSVDSMERLHKKCLIASLGTHGLLLIVVIFGSAFFVVKKKDVNIPAMRVVPGKLVDALVAGGGGNPNIAPSEDKIKGDTLVEQTRPPQLDRVPTPPKIEQRQAAPKLTLVPTVRKQPTKKPSDTPLKLTPVSPPSNTKSTPKNDGQTKQRNEIASKVGETVSNLRTGFEQGTAVDVYGPGGEAFANYAQWVKQVYQDAWIVTDDMDNEQATAKVSVTIARDGQVVSAKITRPSGDAALDNSVERTLLKVRVIRPFPDGAKENQRTFIINFNLKAKRAIG